MISFVASACASCHGSDGAPSSPGLPETLAEEAGEPGFPRVQRTARFRKARQRGEDFLSVYALGPSSVRLSSVVRKSGNLSIDGLPSVVTSCSR